MWKFNARIRSLSDVSVDTEDIPERHITDATANQHGHSLVVF